MVSLPTVSDTSYDHEKEPGFEVTGKIESPPLFSRRNFLMFGAGAAGALVIEHAARGLSDSNDTANGTSQAQDLPPGATIIPDQEVMESDQPAVLPAETLKQAALKYNQASLIESVPTTTGITFSFYEARNTPANEPPLTINPNGVDFMVRSLVEDLDTLNTAAGAPFPPDLVTSVQDDARTGKLGDVTIDVIVGTTGSYIDPENALKHDGANFGPFTEYKPGTPYPQLIIMSPNIHAPGPENELQTLPTDASAYAHPHMTYLPITPIAEESLAAYLAHETGHTLINMLGRNLLPDQSKEHDHFVTPATAHYLYQLRHPEHNQPPQHPLYVGWK